jgi:hypothetical protein
MAVMPEPTRRIPGLGPRRRFSRIGLYAACAFLAAAAASLLAWSAGS